MYLEFSLRNSSEEILLSTLEREEEQVNYDDDKVLYNKRDLPFT